MGQFRDFRISNYQLMMTLIDCCRDMPIEDILGCPLTSGARGPVLHPARGLPAQLQQVATVHDSLVVLDLRNEEVIYAGKLGFVVCYVPQYNLSMQ